jgi:predicted amidophosphoribosyltransferase
MANLPSNLAFVSLLQYAPRGQSDPSVHSRDVTYKIKQDGYVGRFRIIDFAAERLEQVIASHPFLGDHFNASVTLVPVPRSSPLIRPDALWPSLRICQAILARGLGADVLSCIERTRAVRKSSTARTGHRPGPAEHYASVRVVHEGRPAPSAITLVDDVVTRGATFLGIVPRLEEAFPGVEIRCFAMVRTRSDVEIDRLLDPVEGTIAYDGVELRRHP